MKMKVSELFAIIGQSHLESNGGASYEQLAWATVTTYFPCMLLIKNTDYDCWKYPKNFRKMIEFMLEFGLIDHD